MLLYDKSAFKVDLFHPVLVFDHGCTGFWCEFGLRAEVFGCVVYGWCVWCVVVDWRR